MAAECDSSWLQGTALCPASIWIRNPDICSLSPVGRSPRLASPAWLPCALVSSSIELRVWSQLLSGLTLDTLTPGNRRSPGLCSEDRITTSRVLSWSSEPPHPHPCLRQMGLLGDSSSELIPCTGPLLWAENKSLATWVTEPPSWQRSLGLA